MVGDDRLHPFLMPLSAFPKHWHFRIVCFPYGVVSPFSYTLSPSGIVTLATVAYLPFFVNQVLIPLAQVAVAY